MRQQEINYELFGIYYELFFYKEINYELLAIYYELFFPAAGWP